MRLTLKEFLFTKKYGSLYSTLRHFFKYRIPFVWKWNEYHNPYYHWWKARKHFRRPKMKLIHHGEITWFYGLPICNDYYNKVLDIRFRALGWKSKFDSPRHEWNPFIAITLFKKWQVVWMVTFAREDDPMSITRNMATWEAMLDYLYFDIPFEELSERHRWKDLGKNIPIMIDENLL